MGVMMTSSELSDGVPRLLLSPRPGVGAMDGAWWPHSRDFETEIADLIDHFPASAGRVSRVLFSRPDWDTCPRQIMAGRGRVKTGSFPEDDTHLVLLKLSSGVELKVLVVPSRLSDGSAQALMESAADPANRQVGSDLLASIPGQGASSLQRWDWEGGASSGGG